MDNPVEKQSRPLPFVRPCERSKGHTACLRHLFSRTHLEGIAAQVFPVHTCLLHKVQNKHRLVCYMKCSYCVKLANAFHMFATHQQGAYTKYACCKLSYIQSLAGYTVSYSIGSEARVHTEREVGGKAVLLHFLKKNKMPLQNPVKWNKKTYLH